MRCRCDGLDREKRVRQSKLTEQTLALGQMKARDDLAVGVDKLYTQLEKAQDNVKALNATIALSEELVRIRKKSFTEGMATSTEVIDAETMLASVKVPMVMLLPISMIQYTKNIHSLRSTM